MAENPTVEAMTLVEAGQIEETRRPIFRLILIMSAILLMILPFVTTFNEFLTRLVETSGLDFILTDWIVPFEVRMVSVILAMVGIPSQVSLDSIYLDKGGFYMPLYISWNCVGWQSFVLYVATLITGIQGPFTRISKVEAMVVGFLGTFLLNLLRIASVAMVAFWFGQLPAVIYHDYGGTVIILIWLFIYWWFCHGWLLEPLEELPETGVEEPYLKEIYRGEKKEKRRKPFWRRA